MQGGRARAGKAVQGWQLVRGGRARAGKAEPGWQVVQGGRARAGKAEQGWQVVRGGRARAGKAEHGWQFVLGGRARAGEAARGWQFVLGGIAGAGNLPHEPCFAGRDDRTSGSTSTSGRSAVSDAEAKRWVQALAKVISKLLKCQPDMWQAVQEDMGHHEAKEVEEKMMGAISYSTTLGGCGPEDVPAPRPNRTLLPETHTLAFQAVE